VFSFTIFQILTIIFLFFVNTLLISIVYKHIKSINFFFSPLLLFTIDYIVSYVFKPLVIIFPIIDKSFYNIVYTISENDFVKGFVFSTFYFLIFVFFYLMFYQAFAKNINFDKIKLDFTSNKVRRLSLLLFILTTLVVIYFFYNSQYIGLVSEENRSIFIIILDHVFQLYPILIVYSIFTNNKLALLLTVILILLVSLISTAKGHLFWVLIFSVLSWKQLKFKINYAFIFSSLILTILFVNYSYIFRYTQSRSSYSDFSTTLEVASQSVNTLDVSSLDFILSSLLNRFESFENMLYIDNQRYLSSSLLYNFGSLLDLQFIIPSFIYRNPEALRSHYMMSMDIIGNIHFSSANFDRIMEAYLFDFYGLPLSIISALIFSSFNLLLRRNQSVFGSIIFIILLRYNFSTPIFSSLSILLVFSLLILSMLFLLNQKSIKYIIK